MIDAFGAGNNGELREYGIDAIDLAIVGGTLVFDGAEIEADLFISDGKIVGLGHDLPIDAAEVIDAGGKFVLPGLIDIDAHVDIAPTGRLLGDQLRSATHVGARGGFTTVILDAPAAMPLERTQQALGSSARQDVALRAAVATDAERAPALASAAAGGCGLRTALRRVGALGPIDEGALLALLAEAKGKTTTVVFPQAGALGDRVQMQIAQSGAAADPAQLRQALHPSYLGEIGLRLLAALCEASGATRVAALPITSRSQVEVLAELARNAPARLLAATALPYLIFAQEEIDPKVLGRIPAGYPPPRSAADRDALWRAIDAGLIDAIGTASSLTGDDLLGNPLYALPGLYTEGVLRQRVAFATLARLLTDNPAKLFGLYPRKGTLLPGADADVVIFDAEAPAEAAPAGSPFAPHQLVGRVTDVFLRGQPVVREGAAVAQPPMGQVVAADLVDVRK